MELREFAERVLFARCLQEKLEPPGAVTDERPGQAFVAPDTPGRPPELRFKSQHTGKAAIPGLHSLDKETDRGRLLHFFANHELLATELMALVLLRFPEAPQAFRRAVLQTLKDEQQHTLWYLNRMRACKIGFGELPVSGYFWRSISKMESPLDYVAGLSLTFEQANLDFARFFARGFAQAGDKESSQLLERIYQDEIGHVASGLKWFRRWKDPDASDWDAYRHHLKFPLSAQRAKGPVFNEEGRIAAGFGQRFIDELKVYSQSKGRTPAVFVFNPFAEGYIAHRKTFTPNKHQQRLKQDLENLPQYLCQQDDVVLVHRRLSASFLSSITAAGYAIPEFVELKAERIDTASSLVQRKLSRLSPWAWSPDSLELFQPLFSNLSAGSRNPENYYDATVATLYAKDWRADLLRKVLARRTRERHERFGQRTMGSIQADKPTSWLCEENVAGLAARTLEEVTERIEAIRSRGHQAVVLKEALGIAGHNAIRLLEPQLLETQRTWIRNIVENGGRLVVEPWLKREADFSVQLEMGPKELRLIGYTELFTDWKGQFQGNSAEPGFRRRIPVDLARLFPEVPGITQLVQELYLDIIQILGQELREAGFTGPAGIDAFVYRTPKGACRLKPIVEINPRYTMGRLTLELMRNVLPGSTGTLCLMSRKRIESDGCDDFSTWARVARENLPLRLEGDPIPRIREGTVCLNDPEQAQVCLAVFKVRAS